MKRILFGVFFSLGCLIVFGAFPAAAADQFSVPPQCELNGLYGMYYRLTKDDALITDDNAKINSFFLDDRNILQSSVHISLFDLPQTDERRFPDKNDLPGAPDYFAAHYNGVVIAPRAGTYRVTLSSHEASQLFVNGEEIIAVPSNHAYGGKMIWMELPAGTSTVDVYFAKRSDFNTGLVFRIEGEGIRFSPCGADASPALMAHESDATERADTPTGATTTQTTHIVSAPPQNTITAGALFLYDVDARSEQNADMIFQLVDAPLEVMIVPSTGFIFWRPAIAQARSNPYRITVAVSDGTQRQAYQSFELSVSIPVTNSVLSQTINNNDNSGMSAVAVESTALADVSVQESNDVLSHTQTAADAGKRFSATALFTGVVSLFAVIKTQLRLFAFFVFIILAVSLILYGILEIIAAFKFRSRFQGASIRRTA